MPERQVCLSRQVYPVGIGGRTGGEAGCRARIAGISSWNGTQDAVARRRGGHSGESTDALGLTYTFIIGEEERAVLHDGTAEGAAKLISLEGWNRGGVEEVSSVE